MKDKSVMLSAEQHRDLMKLQGKRQAQTGKKDNLADLVGELVKKELEKKE